MQKSENTKQATTTRRKVQASTTLNRKYVRKPNLAGDVTVSIKRSPSIRRFASSPQTQSRKIATEEQTPLVRHPMQETANQKMQVRKMGIKPIESSPSAKELKDRAIQKALANAEAITTDQQKGKSKKGTGLHFGFGRIMLALSCAAVIVFAIVYFVNTNMPDLSLRVAAMQTGINASYPSYVPRDFNVSSITSEDGKITLEFRNASTDERYVIVEEASSWDSNALLSNYVKETYGENYTIVREQGLTIYMSNSDAAWVNGGIVYKIRAQGEVLSNKQIRSIATSL